MNWNLKGSGVALVTPFKEDWSINYDKLEVLINFHVEHNTDALIIAGTTGEASTLSKQEHEELIQKSVQMADGRIPVIAGTGSNETQRAIQLSQRAEQAGADGLLIVTPYYNKTNTKGIIKHYEAIADATNSPIILYNVPSRTGMNIPLEAMVHLSHNDKIVAVKEASGDMSYASEVRRLCAKDFVMLSGNDDIIVPMLAVGSSGVISVLANVLPQETHDIVQHFLDGNTAESLALQLRCNGFVHSLFYETNPIPVKTAMNLMGMEVGGLRLPLYEMSEAAQSRMEVEMKKMGLGKWEK